MKNHNSDLIIKCPQSGVHFHPRRLNQMFLTTYHGWTYRNRLNRIKESDIAHKMKANLCNLKIIISLLPNLVEFNAAKYIELEGFDWDAANEILNPFKKQSTDVRKKYYNIHGFIIRKGITGIRIYSIKSSEMIMILKNINLL